MRWNRTLNSTGGAPPEEGEAMLSERDHDLIAAIRSDLIGERTDLQRRLAESEASAAIVHAAVERVWNLRPVGCVSIPIADFASIMSVINTNHAGRDFLAAARLCRDALLAAPDGYVDREALAAIKQFVA